MQFSTMELREALRAEREATFFRLRGGYPVPLAGAVWWGLLGVAGYRLRSHFQWNLLAFYMSGLIFPLAVLFGKLFRVNFMGDRTAISDLLVPMLVSMALFWPVAFSAFSSAPELVPLVMAIGMSVAWPVMGWTYGRTAIFTAHAVVRAVVCFVIWNWMPAGRFTVLPLAVSGIYLVTVAVTWVASSPGRQRAISLGGQAEAG
jgi:hypothetical protein